MTLFQNLHLPISSSKIQVGYGIFYAIFMFVYLPDSLDSLEYTEDLSRDSESNVNFSDCMLLVLDSYISLP
jgi:hypothetical protein